MNWFFQMSKGLDSLKVPLDSGGSSKRAATHYPTFVVLPEILHLFPYVYLKMWLQSPAIISNKTKLD